MKERTGYFYFDKSRQRWVGRVTYKDPITGKRRNKKCYAETKTVARIELNKIKAKIEIHGAQIVASERLTFAQLAEVFRKEKLIPAVFVGDEKVAGLKNHETPSLYLDVLIEHFGKKRLDAIAHSDIEAFKLKRRQTPTKHDGQRSIASVHRELEVLRRVLNYAVRNRKLATSPFSAITGTPLIQRKRENKRDRVPTFGEELALLGVCVDRRTHLADLLVIAADTGLRKNELLTLAWKTDIDFVSRQINVRAVNAKTNTERPIPMTERVYNRLLNLHVTAKDQGSDLVFGGLGDMKKAFGTACRLTKIENLHWHDLRHAFVTRTILAGIPPAVVLKASGHSSDEWKRYLNVTPDVLRGLLNPLPEQDAKEVHAYGIEVLRQLTTALGYVWRDGMEWTASPLIQQSEVADNTRDYVN